MNQALDSFLTFWKYWMFPSFGLGIIGVVILIYVLQVKPNNKEKLMAIGFLLFVQVVGTWFVGFGLLWVVQLGVREELQEFLKQPNIIVQLNGETIPDNEAKILIQEIKKVDSYIAHHSHPTDQILVELITDDQNFPLSIERDSEISTEYWIFTNKYKTTSGNEIGRIQTEIFN